MDGPAFPSPPDLEALLAELAAADPADAPDLADRLAEALAAALEARREAAH